MRLEQQGSTPLWKSDELDSPVPPLIEPAYFDQALGVWVLSSYADVLAALRSPHLEMDSKLPPTEEDKHTMEKMRQDTIEALSRPQLRTWSQTMTPRIVARLASLPENVVLDLVDAYLRPVCLDLAAIVTEIDEKDAARLRDLAEPISALAAEPDDQAMRSIARAVKPELAGCFHAKAETLRDSGFIALSHTLPSLLANACYALLQHPAQWTMLHQKPESTDQAIDELFRYAGLTRYVRRRASQNMVLGGASIRKHDRLILRLIAANHDPERFTRPRDLEVHRRGSGQLALGAGAHACVGASLLRMASAAILRPLLARFASASSGGPVEWRGGSGFRAPSHLPVIFRTKTAIS